MQENEDVLLQEIIEKWLVEKRVNVKETTFERYQCVTNILTDYFVAEPRNIQRRLKEFCNENLGINMNFHCLRHTFATLAISRGIDEKTVSEILGHSSVTTTLKIYRGVNFDDKVNGIRTLEAFIGPKKN